MIIKIETQLLNEDVDLLDFSILSILKSLSNWGKRAELLVIARTLKVDKKTICRRLNGLRDTGYIVKGTRKLTDKAIDILSFEIKKENEKREIKSIKEAESSQLQKLFNSVYDKLRC